MDYSETDDDTDFDLIEALKEQANQNTTKKTTLSVKSESPSEMSQFEKTSLPSSKKTIKEAHK